MTNPPKLPRRLATLTALALAALASVHGLALAGPAATVMFASGEVKVHAAGGAARAAVNGGVIDSGETIETSQGRVQLRMVDGALMSLSERTTLRLDE